jgi:glutathione S-transferase
MLMWAAKMQLAVPDNLAAFSARMRERPAVKLALKHEGLA